MRNSVFLMALFGLIFFACHKPSISSDPAVIAQGKELFTMSCSACHTLHQEGIGPPMVGITAEADPAWLAAFIRDPQGMIDGGDDRAKMLLARYKQPMPGFSHFSDEEIYAILSYLHNETPRAAVSPAAELGTPVARPQPDSTRPSGITFELERWASLPASSDKGPAARINLMREGPGGQLFLHDLRGKMYRLSPAGAHSLYFDLPAAVPAFIDQPGLGTGFGAFAFHPDFADNGLLYTTHTEKAGAAPADFAYHDSIPVTLQGVLSEWKTTTPGAATFQGERRELLRIDFVTGIHGMQEIAFRNTAKPGEPDRNTLYTGLGDGGSAIEGFVELPGKKTSIWGSVIRIDPAGTNSANGRYGIPADNPFAQSSEPGVVREIWVYGFRNPHRFSWDRAGTGALLIADIGQDQVEEINLAEPGADYGWPRREGPYLIDPIADLPNVYPLPEDDASLGIRYPLAFYDHHTGEAIAGGEVYRSARFPELQGYYFMGDIPTGWVLGFDYDALVAGVPAPVQSFKVQFEGKTQPFSELTGRKRVDLHLAFDSQGNLYFLTKGDGSVWRVKNVLTNPS